MKFTRIIYALALASVASLSSAHEYEMFPVEMDIRIESTQVRVQIRSHAIYWIEKVMHLGPTQELPATNWIEAHQDFARKYVNQSFQLRMDGQSLDIGKFECRFVQEPLDRASAKVIFDITYPLRNPGIQLSGSTQFFKEYYEEVSNPGPRHEEDGVFVTHLTVIGDKSLKLDLPMEKPDFAFPVEGYSFTQGQAQVERLMAWGKRMVSSPFFWIFLAVLINQIYIRFFRRREE